MTNYGTSSCSHPAGLPFDSLRLTHWLMLVCATFLFAAAPVAPAWAQEAPPSETEEKRDQEKETPQEEGGEGEAADDETQEDEADDNSDANRSGEKQGKDASSNDNDSEESESDNRPRRRRRRDLGKLSDQFLGVFEPVVKDTRQATVQVMAGKRQVALGAIVDPAGFVLTKHSELKSPITCVLPDGRSLSASVYGVDEDTDLALLHLSGDDLGSLPVVRWSQGPALEIGTWLATVREIKEPVVVGIVGVKERYVRPKSGFMGVNLGEQDGQVVIGNVNPDTPAERAGVKANDVVLEVEGESFSNRSELIAKVQSYAPGDEIELKLLRNKKEITLRIILGDAEELNPAFERSNQQNTMGGNQLSKRRQNFPLAVQHDTFLKPEECGGPVVNIDGEVVGINIARQGRVSSLMLPASLILPVIAELKSGQFAPALVNQKRIEEINRQLKDLRTQVNLSPAGADSSSAELDELKRAEREARTNLDKALEELEAAREARIRAEVTLQNATRAYEASRKRIETLEKELQRLVSGAQ